MATINTNLAGVTSGSQYASAGNNTIYTNLPFNTAGSTTTDVTFFVGASSSIDILYNQNFRVDSTTGFHELFGNIEVQGVSSDYTVSSWYGKVVLTHKTSGQVISFQLTKPENSASNSGVNVQFLDGAIAFTSNVNAQGVWTVWATEGGNDTSTWGAGGLATQVPGTYSPGATPLDLSVASDVGYLNYSVNSSDVTDWTGTGSGATYTLTTGVDTFTGTPYDDEFNAPLVAGVQTLNTLDSLNGNGGTDTLNAFINSSVTPRALNSIEIINASFSATSTLNLVNAPNVTNVNNVGSSSGAVVGTVSNIVAGADLGVQDLDGTGGAGAIFIYASTAGTQSVDLSVSSVTNAGAITIAGVEQVNIESTGASNSINLVATSAQALVFSGTENLTVASLNTAGDTSVSSIDASLLSGNLTITTGALTGVAAGTDVSITGGDGNDSITTTGTTQDLTINGGAGNDTFVDTGLSTTDSIDGGAGTNTISTVSATAVTLAGAARTTFDNIQTLTVTDTFDDGGAAFVAGNIDSSIATLNLAAGGATTVTAGAETVTGGAGTFTMNLGSSAAANVADLNGTLTVNDTGTASTDTLVLNNLSVVSTTNTQVDVFGNVDLTSTGYENVSINTGSGISTRQTINTLTINGDVASANTSLTLAGLSNIDVNTGIVSNTTGTLTINASAVTAQALATRTVGINNVTVGTGGSIDATLSSGSDDIGIAGAFASTIRGGAGNDTLEGNTAADSIDGGADIDSITGAGGNDTLRGGDGNDIISAIVAGVVSIDGGADNDVINIAATLNSGDLISGGSGTDTLRMSTALIANFGGVTEIEILQIDAGADFTQDLSRFTGTTLNQVDFNPSAGTYNLTLSNAASTLTELRSITTTGTLTFSNATNTTSNALTLGAQTNAAATIGAVIANDLDTLTFGQGAITTAGTDFTVTALTSTDVDSIVITGTQDTIVTGLTAGGFGTTDRTVSINASATTGNVSLTLTNQNDTGIVIAFTGATATGTSSVIGGSGNDILNGGTAANTLTGGDGNDSITGGAAADSLTGSAGADSVSGQGGVDSITGGDGADYLTGGAAADNFYQASLSASVAASGTSLSATVTAGDTITFANGVDTITDFTAGAGGDVLFNLYANGALPTTLIGETSANLTGATETFFASGNYNTLTGVFTITADGSGADTLIVQADNATGASDNLSTNASMVILVGVDSDNLVAANFDV